jgi:hypothetical protein
MFGIYNRCLKQSAVLMLSLEQEKLRRKQEEFYGKCAREELSRIEKAKKEGDKMDCNNCENFKPKEPKKVKDCLTCKHSIHHNSTKTRCKIAEDCNRGDRRFFLWEPAEPKESKGCSTCKHSMQNNSTRTWCKAFNCDRFSKWEPVEPKEERKCKTCRYCNRGLPICISCTGCCGHYSLWKPERRFLDRRK